MNREQFNTITKPLIEKIVNETMKFIRDRNFEPSDFQSLLLAGGSSRILNLQDQFRECDFNVNVSPEANALGAAYYAAPNVSEPSKFKNSGICEHALGEVRALFNGQNSCNSV